MLNILGYLSVKVVKYSILRDIIIVFRQSDGPVVDLVAVRVRAGEFFAGHGRWNEVVTSR